jgi:hypothetical protein
MMIAYAFSMKGKESAPVVDDLMEGSALLNALNTAFLCSYQDSLKSCFVVSFYETMNTKPVSSVP